MGKNHLKLIAAPKTWHVRRKEKKYIMRPHPGPHSLESCLTLNAILIDYLHVAQTKKEATYILQAGKVKVNGIVRKDNAFGAGVMDVVSIESIGRHCRIIINKKGSLAVQDIDEKEAGIRPCKIIGKSFVKGKMVLNFSDGTNKRVDKDVYRIGDTLLIDAKKDIVDHVKLEKGCLILLTQGKHRGVRGKIEQIEGNNIIYRVNESEVFQTLKRYALVIGKDTALITA